MSWFNAVVLIHGVLYLFMILESDSIPLWLVFSHYICTTLAN